MRQFDKLRLRLRSLLRRRVVERELDDELRFHLDQLIEEEIAVGVAPSEARHSALRKLGGISQVQEACRDTRRVNLIDDLLRDLRYGARALRRNPGFAAVALLSIALGIGANTAIFSLVEALILRSLPVPDPQGLIQVQININGTQSDSFSYPVITALAERNDVFRNLGGFSGNTFAVGPADARVRVSGARVSGGYFSALEVQPQVGRLLGPEDDKPGAPLVAVISDGYWERNFGRAPRAVGQAILVEGQPTTIVGVTPVGFTGAEVGRIADLTMTFQTTPRLFPDRPNDLAAGNQYNRILARRAAGLTMEQAQARLKVIWPAMADVSVTPQTPAQRREAMLKSVLTLNVGATGWSPLRNQFRKPLYVLLTISGLVLLVACANVANLLLARATARRREIAVRLAIGANRGRIVRQLLVESFLLAAMGALLGVGLAQWGSLLLLHLVSSGPQAITLPTGINVTVLLFAAAVTVLTGTLFGLAPAFRATSAGAGEALKTGRSASGSRGRLAQSLVSLQVALSLLLLIAAGLFVRSLRNLESVDPGFRHAGVLMFDVDARRALHAAGPENDARISAFFRDALSSIAQQPGVTAVTVSNFTPISGGYWSLPVIVNGKPVGEDLPFFGVAPGYFDTLQIRRTAGRDFTLHDDNTAPRVAIVNEAFVRRYLPGGSAVGQIITTDWAPWQNMEIVGVVADTVPYTLRQGVRPCVFVSFFQQASGRMSFATFEVRVAGSLSSASAGVLGVLGRALPGASLQARAFSDQVESSMRRERLMAQLSGFFGSLALVLSAIGLYGLLAYLVTQRTGEIGIRMALGARRTQVVWMVLQGALRLVLVGVLLGLPAAWWGARFIRTMLFGLSPTDPLTIAAAVALLGATALLAAFLPAHRAARVEPMVALRCE